MSFRNKLLLNFLKYIRHHVVCELSSEAGWDRLSRYDLEEKRYFLTDE